MKDILIFQNEKLKISFAWYDLWVGLFVDADKKKLYFCPIPTILFTLKYE